MPKKRTLSSTFEYQQTYRRPARYTDKVVLGTLGFIFMISDLAQAPPSQILHVPLLLAGIGSYIVATIAGRALRAVAQRQKLYSATRRASTRWTPATREHWLTATAIGNAAAIGLSAWFVALTVKCRLSGATKRRKRRRGVYGLRNASRLLGTRKADRAA